jgi:hypothetical protein
MKRLIVAIMVLAFAVPSGAARVKKVISPGDFFPGYTFGTELSSGDAAYLGVSEKVEAGEAFTAPDVWGEVLVVELFNRYCFGCQQGAPLINDAYNQVAADPSLSTKVRFIGVGVGNNLRTVNDFRREFEVPFPLVPDPTFSLLDELGNPGGTPYTMVLRRTPKGMMLMGSHFGVLDSSAQLVGEIREILEGDVETLLAQAEPTELANWVEEELKVPLTDTEVVSRVEASMARAGYGQVGLYTVDLPSGEKVYVGDSENGKVFSRVISRLPVCDVCHPVHFIITVDSLGNVVDFDAISVTKYWNKPWTDEEEAWMKDHIVGMSVFDNRVFDPDVDAVSTATMSSSLIIDSLVRSGKVMETLEEMGKF